MPSIYTELYNNVMNNTIPNQEEDTLNYNLHVLIIPICIIIIMCLLIQVQFCIWDCQTHRIVDDMSIYSQSLTYSSIDSSSEFVIQPKPSIFFIKNMTQSSVNNPLEVKDICPICLEAYEEQDLLVTMPCGHQYHKTCIHPWLRNSIDADITPLCAICKAELVVEYREKVEEQENCVIIEK